MNYTIKTELFSGPLEKLLELIEEKKLEITAMNLAEVTGDFLNYLKTIQEKTEPGILADFVVIAAKLILIKSKALLPNLELTKDEETEIKDLETRLKIYNEFRIAAQHIKKLAEKGLRSYSKPLLAALEKQTVFYPPQELKLSDLSQAALNLADLLKKIVPEPQKIKSAIITIEQKIEELLQRFQTAAEHSFKEVTKSRPKMEIVIFFLAILHLLKDRIIDIEQKGQFEDILIKKPESQNGNPQQ